MPRITELWAWVIEDSAPDDEGVAAFLDPSSGMWMPLVGADRGRANSLRQFAQAVASAHGKPIKLVRSTGELEVVETVEP